MRLIEWAIEGEDTIRGTVRGSMRYPDGTKIRTSRVIAAAYDGEMLMVRTQNSIYECWESDYTGDPEQLLIFIRTMVDDLSGTTAIRF
jgi:hypothetical protein